MALRTGLYDQLITRGLAAELAAAATLAHEAAPLDPAEGPDGFAQHLAAVLAAALPRLKGEDRLAAQLAITNALIRFVAEEVEGAAEEEVLEPVRRLHRVVAAAGVVRARAGMRPDTPLSLSSLLTGTRVDPSLESQLRKELATADRVDILCSFVKWGGVRILREALEEFTGRSDARLRVITTSYIGATDPKALDYLIGLPRAEVRVSYDTKHTRLHAKAYLIHRDTGFSCGYVGSANLSHAAMTDGLEWTVKVSQRETLHLWRKLSATFESYWNDAEFCRYTPDERPRLIEAIRRERGGDGATEPSGVYFDLSPHDFQREILDAIEAERQNTGKTRHLVVAATGTGKTMVAAFDYRRWCDRAGTPTRPRLLYIAHRAEILEQARQKFRHVLRDANFGEVLYGGHTPPSLDHLFCTVQSFNSRDLAALPADHFDYVVVDEFHHAAAASYRPLLEHLRPLSLLGLTATPERADLLDVFAFFGGRATAEIRLPDAVTRKLLCPFQYFGLCDPVDLSTFQWCRGAYLPEQLEAAYTGDHVRTQIVIDKVLAVLTDVRRARGLGFCVGVRHAEYMAAAFNSAGIPAAVLTGDSNATERATVQGRLVRREVNFVFTVDLYNEGVDIPEVDTVLFLRPTESLTVFLQQLGRGLRHHESKEHLTILDFVGRQHASFRFDRRFRALLSDPTRNVEDEVARDLPHLPPGCSVVLERQAREYILENIRQAVISSKRAIRREYAEVRAMLGRPPTFEEFLRAAGLDPIDLYRRDVTLSRLASGPDGPELADEIRLTRGMQRLSHIDDPHWIHALLRLLDPAARPPPEPELDEASRRYIAMSHQSLWYDTFPCPTASESLTRVRASPLAAEIAELLRFNLARIPHPAPIPALPFACPLALHARYTLHEALAGLGHWTTADRPRFTEGPLHLKPVHADAFFVTLNKSEAHYSPTTMYDDYAISERLFHWQSQSTTPEDSEMGRRYREHAKRGHTILLFVRENFKGPAGSEPYFYLGPATYVQHTGSRPMSITWRLSHPMPAAILRVARRLAV